MGVPRETTRAYASVVAMCIALGLAAESCGVLSSSSDCAERATCPEAGGSASSGSGGGSGGTDEGPEGATAEAGDDGNEQGEDATEDVTSENPTVGDESGDTAMSRDVGIDVASEDSAMRDVTGDADASMDVARDVGIRDVATDEAARSDVCVPTAATEDCTNGIDDNCDGLTDCAETSCKTAGYVCTTTVPSGWTGPALLWTGAFGSAAPNCPAGYAMALDANAGPTGSAGSCSCVCAPSGQTCSVTGTFHQDQACMSACGSSTITVTVSSSGGCISVPPNSCGSGGSFIVAGGVPAPSGGSCGPTVTTTVGPAPGWTTVARVCSWSGSVDTPGGCMTAGEQCVLAGPGGFGTKLCVYQGGDNSCPVSYPNKNLFYSAESDSRDCGSCTCGSTPSGGACAGTIGMWGDLSGGCGGTAAATYTLGGPACQSHASLSNVPGFVQANYTVTPGTCSIAAQPQPTGAVTGTGPTTVCCK